MKIEEKKSLKISLSTFFLFLAIIAITIMGYFIYKLYNDKITSAEKITNLNNKISNLESTVDRLQGTINNVSNNSQSNENETSSNKYTEITNNLEGIDVLYVTNVDSNNNTYTLKGILYTQYTLSNTELQQTINNGTIKIDNKNYTIENSENINEYDLYETNAEYPLYKIKQLNSNKYYLEAQAQISDVWKLTNEYKEITVSGDTKCSMVFDYGKKYNTVEDVFKNFNETEPVDTTNPNAEKTFKFNFENGKCVEVINVLTTV